MTEQEWFGCARPCWMLNYLRPWKSRERKMWLYVAASCARPYVWDRLKEPCLILLDVAIRHADGLVEREEYEAAIQTVSKMTKHDKLAGGKNGPPLFGQALLDFLRLKHLPGYEGDTPPVESLNYLGDEMRRTRETLRSCGMNVITEEQAVDVQKYHDAFMKDHANFLRDLFGNPFRPVTLDTAWQSSKVVGMAQSIYDDRAFDRLPALADALEEAGCTNTDLLAHCRSEGPHVRGCWVVDLVLG